MEINTRELILEILLETDREGRQCQTVIGNVLDKHQFLPKCDRAFITRISEGTIEYRIQLDYIIDCVSDIKVKKMKPVIREILRMSVYQMRYMDSVPDRAAVNEAVKLAQRKGFRNLKSFVNGVLRNISRRVDDIVWPDRSASPARYLSVRYSMPEMLVKQWCGEYGEETCEKILGSFLEHRPLTVRFSRTGHDTEQTIQKLEKQGVRVTKANYAKDAYILENYDYLASLDAFADGDIQVQDPSSMLVAQAAGISAGDFVLDLCAAPGGKSLHAADLLNGTGMVESRDISDYKVGLIQDNIERLGLQNIRTQVKDASRYYQEDEGCADIVLCDVPCSGYGVIGKKPDIKYKASHEKQESLLKLQREILKNAARYTKDGGVLIYSTCTIGKSENIDQVMWFTKHFPFQLESLDPYFDENLHLMTTKEGYLQLLPGCFDCDGFFLARLKKQESL